MLTEVKKFAKKYLNNNRRDNKNPELYKTYQ